MAGMSMQHAPQGSGMMGQDHAMPPGMMTMPRTAFSEAEMGMQEIWGDNPLLGIAKELGVAMDGKVESPFSSLVLEGKLYPFLQNSSEAFFQTLFTSTERAALKGWMASAKLLRTRAQKVGLKDSEVRKLQDLSFGDWVESAKLSKRVNDWIRMTLECELATDWKRCNPPQVCA